MSCYLGAETPQEDAPPGRDSAETGSLEAGTGGPDSADTAVSPDSNGPSGPDGPPDPPPEHDAAEDLDCDAVLAPSPWLKLSTVQYRNTVNDLLRTMGADDVVDQVASALGTVPDDSAVQEFRGLDDRISPEHIQGYFNVSKVIAEAFTADAEALQTYIGSCAAEAPLSETCLLDFLDAFVQRGYRRPLSEDEVERFVALNDGSRSPAEVLRAVIIVAMNSPHFVSHVETHGTPSGGSDELFELSAHELASRLSYTFWQTAPDDALWEAAEDGSLATEAGFLAQVDRVFADPRTRETLWVFWQEWLKLEKFTGFETSRPGFRALMGDTDVDAESLYAQMLDEIRTLTELFTFDETATLADLMETPISVTSSSDLAALYGVQPWDGTGDFAMLDSQQRGGLFQRAALLVNALEQTNPFHRGAFFRRTVLCDLLPQPDPNSLPPGSLDPPPVDEAQSTRQRYAAKVDGNPLCTGCHAQFSDLGYLLEAYDSLGRFRTEERVFDEQTGEELAVLPVDLTTTPRITASDEQVIDDVEHFNQTLIASGKVDKCLAQNFYRFVMRRALASNSYDGCVHDDLTEKVRDASVGLGGAFKAIVRYPSFLQRKVGPQ